VNEPVSYILALVVMLGGLIFVHELGHFVVAKLCGVRVLKFSLGFGPTIGMGRYRLAWRRGETEYVIAWFPLGGFVKMLGENPDEEESGEALSDPQRAFNRKPVWQRLAIVLAGPGMNFALPIFVFAAALGFGMPRPAPVVGTVELSSPAEEAGVHAGDRVVAVDGTAIRWWDDVDGAVRSRTAGAVTLRIEREGRPFEFEVPVTARAGLDLFGDVRQVGWIGISHLRMKPTLGVPAAGSSAARAGLRSGDRILSLDGAELEDWTALAQRYAAVEAGRTVRLGVERRAGEESQRLELPVPALGSVSALGVVPATVLLEKVTPGSPAERAGLAPGDLIASVDGVPVGSFASFAETVRASEGRALRITFVRDGESHEVAVAPELAEVERNFGIPSYLIGIQARSDALPGAAALDQETNPLRSIPRAFSMTTELTGTFLVGFWKIVSGGISPRQLAGPIGIAEIAHDAWKAGWEVFLSRLVLISINLAILNLLPIPVLDGGQAFLLMIEGVKRSPVSLRTREIAQQVGLTALVLLMGFALWNDIARRWDDLIEWMRQSTGL
jgi:regulator of sigma E protease